jgi:alpha,alpha-trehalase
VKDTIKFEVDKAEQLTGADVGRALTRQAQAHEQSRQFFEKYVAADRTSDLSGKILFGYPTNEPGFGWTNAVVADLLARQAGTPADTLVAPAP